MSGRSAIVLGFLVFVFATIIGCGTEGTTLTAPELVMTVSGYKQLNFTWDGLFGITSYDIMCSQDGQSEPETFMGTSKLRSVNHTMEVPVHLLNWGQAQFSIRGHNSADTLRTQLAATTLDRTNSVNANGYLNASNTQVGDQFGQACDISADGTTLVVATTAEDSNAQGINGDQADNSLQIYGCHICLHQRRDELDPTKLPQTIGYNCQLVLWL